MFVGLSLQLSSALTIATPLNIEATNNHIPTQLIFIDSSIENYQDLIADTQTSTLSDNALIVTLDSQSNPIQQITQILQQYKNLNAIHLITHGFSGGLKLGNERLERSTISSQKNQFNQWGKSLSAQGDILLYGCNVAKGRKGSDFIQALSKATQADVIASNNISGNPAEYQDWLLEKSTGTIETASIIPNNNHNHFQSNLDITNGNAFLYGDNIEVGIGPDGAFGSDIASSEMGRKSFGKLLGYISDPSGGKFKNSYHGDFFLPGYPEEGWAITVNGKTYNNNSNIQGAQIRGTLSNFQTPSSGQNVTWKGEVEGLEITQIFRVYTAGIAIVVDITLKNTTDTDMQDVYYMRTVDPDNNAEQDPEINWNNPVLKYTTLNTVLFQGSDNKGGSSITATQDGKAGLFTESLLTLSGYGENSRVTYGGERVREPLDVYTGTSLLKNSGTHKGDESISLAYKFNEIKSGNSVRFRIGYLLADVPIPSIDIDVDDSSGVSGNQYTHVYMLGTAATKISDTDIAITGTGFTNLEEAIISLTNPKPNDKLTVQGSLPRGISIDTSEGNNDTEIHLTGLASETDYKTAIKQIVFNNPNIKSSTETRSFTLQIFDDNFTPSNTAISLIEIITPITMSNPIIAGDDIVSGTEADDIVLTGTAAPNTAIEIVFTDKDGKKITKNIVTDDNGNWTLIGDSADLTSLADGAIKVEIISTDANSNKSSFTKNINKDATIALTNVLPDDNQVITDLTPTFSGKTDPNTTITFKLSPSGKEYTTQADNEGNWSFTFPELPLDSTIDVEIIAEDDAGNKTSTTRTITTPSLPLEVNSLDIDASGLATSTTPTFSGTGKAGTTVTINIPTDTNNSETCTTTTDSEGKWTCEFSELPSGGPYTATITTEDDAGNKTSTTMDLTIPEIPLIINSPSDNAVISGATPTITGTSTPNTTVTVTASTGQHCTAVTDDTNHWRCDLPTLALDDSFTLTITTTDSAENTTTKTIDISTDKLPLSVLTPGDKGTAGDSTPSFIGTSTPGTKITVTASTGVKCETITDADGNWTCELPSLPIGGPYDITIKAEDNNGNITTMTESISIPEVPLIITSPSEDEVFTGSSITLTGTSDPNTEIMVLGPDGEVCKTTSDEFGKWSCELHNLRDGTSKYFTVISGNKAEGQKITILTLDVNNSSEKVKTLINGGGGSLSFFMIMLLGFSLLTRKTILKK